jgi:nucleoside-diphosphate-sugar epimerase
MLHPQEVIHITGSTGFLGTHLKKYLAQEFQVFEYNQRDLSELAAELISKLSAPIQQTVQHTVIHLAGISSPRDCEANPELAFYVNTAWVAKLAAEVFRISKDIHFILPSSSHVYAPSDDGIYHEGSKLSPQSIYASSKLAAETCLKALGDSTKGRYSILRLFNHTHYTQPAHFFLPSIYQQLKSSQNTEVVVEVGNIEVERDFSTVFDFLGAIRAMILSDQKRSGVYNLSSGLSWPLYQVASTLAQKMNKRIQFQVDPQRLRSAEPQKVVGDNSLFSTTFHWKNQSQSLDQFIDGFLR